MKKTTLYNHHIEKDAKMVSFAGFAMPIRYSGIIDEHNTVRNSVGIFDLSHMGEFEISGKGAEDFLQKMTINDVANLEIGQAQYTAMCTNEGGIIDDCVLYRNEAFYPFVVNASNIEKDFLWLNKHLEENVSLIDVSDDTTLIAVQGPESKELLKKVLFDDASKLSRAIEFDIESNWDSAGIVKKDKQFISIKGPIDRRNDESFQRRIAKHFPEVSQESLFQDEVVTGEAPTMIDVLHQCLIFWEQGDRHSIIKLLERSGYKSNNHFWQVAQSISEVLTDGDKEKQLLQGFLYGKEVYQSGKIPSEIRAKQEDLFGDE
ncbi:MAG: hypothetical protein IIB44_10750 [Candidatus Marinimicrobia bacterium]|nr:hypothetical protein [Candidatus Neomarinimicrobiota bacterium]